MIDCTCGFGKDIAEDQASCPVCGADVTPLHRVRGLPRLYLDEGVAAARDGRADFAIERLLTAVSLDEGCGAAHKALGDVYFKKAMYHEALRQYGRAVQLDPDDQSLRESMQDAEAEASRRAAAQSPGRAKEIQWFGKPSLVLSALGFLLGLTALPAVNLVTHNQPSTSDDYARVTAEIKQSIREDPILKPLNLRVDQLNGGLHISGEAPTEVHKHLVSEMARRASQDRFSVVVALEVAAPQTVHPVLYTVRSGDSLSSLAAAQYGDARLWMRIFEANRDKLSSPDGLLVGQVLVIPK